MPKLNPKSFKFKGEIITPIHIWSGQSWDRMDYFIDEKKKELLILNRNWLNACSKKSPNLFKEIISSIEEGDFVKLEELKNKFFKSYLSNSLIIDTISISDEALKHLTMKDKDYSHFDKNGIRGNLGEIKRFSFNKFGDLIIPGSTLKGLFRTMFLMYIVNQEGLNYTYIKNKAKQNKERFFDMVVFKDDGYFNALKDPMAWVSFEDINLKSYKKEIQLIKIRMVNKKTKKVSFVPVVCEVISNGYFCFNLTYSDLYQNNVRKSFGIENIKYALKSYSKEIKKRENRNIENVLSQGKFSNIQVSFLEKDNDNKLVKIGQFKREYTYKIFWNEKYKKFIHIDSFYIDENNNPIGWISLQEISEN